MAALSRGGLIAATLATWLNDPIRAWPMGGWNFEATWDQVRQLEETDTKQVGQIAADTREPNGLASRGKRSREYRLYLSLRQRFEPGIPVEKIPVEWIEERVQMLEAIDDALQDCESGLTAQPTGIQLKVESTEITPYCDPVDLRDLRQWTGGIEIVLRELTTR